jgi:hypothetical protein
MCGKDERQKSDEAYDEFAALFGPELCRKMYGDKNQYFENIHNHNADSIDNSWGVMP